MEFCRAERKPEPEPEPKSEPECLWLSVRLVKQKYLSTRTLSFGVVLAGG